MGSVVVETQASLREIEQKLKAGEVEPARERYAGLEPQFASLVAELTALRASLPDEPPA